MSRPQRNLLILDSRCAGRYAISDRIPPSLAGSHAFRTLDRRILGIVTQARTGYGYFGEYYQTHNIQEPADCPCGAGQQTREHIVFECRTQLTKEHQTTNSQRSLAQRKASMPWPNSSEKAKRSRKREPRRSLRGLQTQNRAIRDTDVQRDLIETRAQPTSPNENLTHESRERQ